MSGFLAALVGVVIKILLHRQGKASVAGGSTDRLNDRLREYRDSSASGSTGGADRTD